MEMERTMIELKFPFGGVKHNNLQKIKSLIEETNLKNSEAL